MESQKEYFNGHPVYALSQIAMSLHRVVERTYPQPYYIKAEILKLNYYPHSGHCYPELVEKEGNSIKAEMRAVIWSANYNRINARFQSITGSPLKENISILCLASIEYSPKHGLALHIQDIEPTYTLGEMMKNRKAVIEKLQKEGVFMQNKNLPMPLLPKRIAVISVETSKGFSDFISTLQHNRYGYCFETKLYPSILQGDKAITGIRSCLDAIENNLASYDCVVIVRGGGGDVGLSCYDDYSLAHRVATFPLPVLTGIGHSTNLSVTDMVAHTYNITPTDVAFQLIGCFQSFDEKVQDLHQRMVDIARTVLAEERNRLLAIEAQRSIAVPKVLRLHHNRLAQLSQDVMLRSRELVMRQNANIQSLQETLQRLAQQRCAREQENILNLQTQLSQSGMRMVKSQGEMLTTLEEKIRILHPDNILKRGFSITRLNGKSVVDASLLKSGDEVVTQMYQGEVVSVVK